MYAHRLSAKFVQDQVWMANVACKHPREFQKILGWKCGSWAVCLHHYLCGIYPGSGFFRSPKTATFSWMESMNGVFIQWCMSLSSTGGQVYFCCLLDYNIFRNIWYKIWVSAKTHLSLIHCHKYPNISSLPISYSWSVTDILELLLCLINWLSLSASQEKVAVTDKVSGGVPPQDSVCYEVYVLTHQTVLS